MRPAAVITLNAAVVAAAMLVTALAPKGGAVAVLISPLSPADAAIKVIARAGGTLVAATGRDWVVVARGADDDFVDRLYRAGAMLVVDPLGLAGCSEDR